MKYEYKEVKGYSEKKFVENGHTMFESDVLQRLKRLAYLEESIKKGELDTVSIMGSCEVGLSTLTEEFSSAMENEKCQILLIPEKKDSRSENIKNLLKSIEIEPLRIEKIEFTAPSFIEKENKNYPNPYSKKNKGFKK